MALPTEPELKRRIKVIAAWTDEEQPAMAEALGVPVGTLRNYFTSGRKGPPLDKALQLADFAEVPRAFVLEGWGAVGQGASPALSERLTEMERQLLELLQRRDG